jgi:hypothetical protein
MTIQEALHAASLEMDRQISADECTVQIDVDPQMFM